MPDYREWLTHDVTVSDRMVLDELQRTAATMATIAAPTPISVMPVEVDLSKYLHFIRCQGGEGCWGYSLLAVWDIMNEMACPYSPNLSLNLGLFLHRRRDLWEKQGGINSPDGHFHKVSGLKWLEQSFGCTTEGTELTHPSTRWTGSWTGEGVNEAGNYRLASDIKKVAVSSTEFTKWLANGNPIQLEDGGHVIAIVGYNVAKKNFKFVNSYGDRYGDNGYSSYTFSQIDNKQGIWGNLGNAYMIDIIPPRPVPATRIGFCQTNRMNVNLWLSVEDSPLPKRKIWPTNDWPDNSQNLHYTVRLPSEFIWPPSKDNRLVLDLYDTGAFSESGGELVEFTAAFGGHVMKCSALLNGPVNFQARQLLRFYIP